MYALLLKLRAMDQRKRLAIIVGGLVALLLIGVVGWGILLNPKTTGNGEVATDNATPSAEASAGVTPDASGSPVPLTPGATPTGGS